MTALTDSMRRKQSVDNEVMRLLAEAAASIETPSSNVVLTAQLRRKQTTDVEVMGMFAAAATVIDAT